MRLAYTLRPIMIYSNEKATFAGMDLSAKQLGLARISSIALSTEGFHFQEGSYGERVDNEAAFCDMGGLVGIVNIVFCCCFSIRCNSHLLLISLGSQG